MNSKPPPQGTRPPPITAGSARPPSNIKDALTEARAVSGGAFGRGSSLPAGQRTARRTILVVDPNAAMRARLKAALAEHYDVVEAKDGVEAVDLANGIHGLALVISDVEMPRMDGFTLAQVLKSHPLLKRVPMMFLSLIDSPQRVTKAMVLGVNHYAVKSAPMTDLVAKIRKIAL
jgi:PleD family two-component response regulator